ncbi:hypothetical protein F3Y22_tig00110482pilonHSYRG00586 [Hibiscus syriacus]|uniref:Lipoxygenase domain-containing protein n=1 Tax=Hibiscus syriacus TaxID=106335 RepID=A0A6A3ADS9_HIBSY|nr:hypothetical protein F3Y22_tig00110482pilonHSYRG00586 [Hibiscus syriacus]
MLLCHYTLDTQPPVQLKSLHLLLQHEIHGKEKIKIGLVNINSNEEIEYKLPGSVVSTVHDRFDRVRRGTKWEDVFPAQNSSHPTPCLEIPMPPLEDYDDLDVVVVKLLCKGKTGRSGRRMCLGFKLICAVCGDLLRKVDDHWVYKPELRRLKLTVLMPRGSCGLAKLLSHMVKQKSCQVIHRMKFIWGKETEWTSDEKPVAAFDEFGERLSGIEERIVEMNNDKLLKNRVGQVNVPYTLLYPSSEGGLRQGNSKQCLNLRLLFKFF